MADIFDRLNYFFANFDAMFRDMEHDMGMGNLLPSISIPSVKTYYTEQRAISDNEKTTYYINGKVSRLDGPAIEYKDEKKENEWWIDGKQTTKEEVEKEYQKLQDERIHHITVDGRHYEVPGKRLKELKSLLKLEDKT